MIAIKPQPEPTDFNGNVRKPGTEFLKKKPHPRPRDWDGKNYWTKALPDLYKAYGRVCAYSCFWIPPAGGESIDHFVPRSVAPNLAYEWSNYRLAGTKFNQRKGSHQDIIDPFKITGDWFVLVFPAMLIKPNSSLPEKTRRLVQNTINILKLNEEILVSYRLDWLLEYCDEDISFRTLQKKAPFIAHELNRQKLVDNIRVMMKRRKPNSSNP